MHSTGDPNHIQIYVKTKFCSLRYTVLSTPDMRWATVCSRRHSRTFWRDASVPRVQTTEVLETKAMRMFAKISQSRRGPSPGLNAPSDFTFKTLCWTGSQQGPFSAIARTFVRTFVSSSIDNRSVGGDDNAPTQVSTPSAARRPWTSSRYAWGRTSPAWTIWWTEWVLKSD